jgi:hypothetical protein
MKKPCVNLSSALRSENNVKQPRVNPMHYYHGRHSQIARVPYSPAYWMASADRAGSRYRKTVVNFCLRAHSRAARAVIAGCVALAASLGPATAQNDVHERNIEYFSETSSGEPIGCGMEFTFIFVDRAYSHGKFAGIDGTLTNFIKDGNLWTTLKLAGFDFPDGLTAKSHPSFPIYDASLDVDGQLFRPTRFNCEAVNEYCGRLEFVDSMKVLNAVDEQGVTLKFNRAKGDFDYNIKLSSEPGSNQDRQTYFDDRTKYLKCMSNILDQAKAALPSNPPY